MTVLERVTCQILLYSATRYIVTYCFLLFLTICSPTIGLSTTSALAARATYWFTPALATPFPLLLLLSLVFLYGSNLQALV